MIHEHLDRVKSGANNVYNLQNLSKFVEKHLYLEGKRYEFGEKYGFQATIIDDISRVTNVVKPAQIGMTTATMAYVLSAACTQRNFNCIYALPTATDAQILTTTKLNPLIQGSPEIKRLLDYNVDNNELKKFGENFVYIRGSRSDTAALSISADVLVADEVDRADPDKLKQFRSRLLDSPYQIVKQFSTPTIEGMGIAKEAETSRRYRHMAKCQCCGNVWLPSYHTDMVVPGYSGDLKEITRENIKNIQWKESHWKCPSCGEDPKLHPNNLEWVCENSLEQYEANTYYVTPVTACLVRKPADLVRSSTEYNTRSEWSNQVLGETSEEENEQITLADLDRAEVEIDLTSSEVHYFGADMGLMCAVAIGRMTQDETLIVVHREMVPISSFESRRRELIKQYKCVNSVHDVMPYTTDIMRLTDNDPNAYGALFSSTKSPELYTLQEKEENPEEGKLNLRLLKVNRTAGLDAIRDLFKQGKIVMRKTDASKAFVEQYLSLKRIQQFVKEELVYTWAKTGTENDHMHFALLYLLLAVKLRGRTQGWVKPGAVPLVTRYRSKIDV